MKYNIYKLQGGGAMVATYTPIERSVPTAPVTSEPSSKETKPTGETSILDKDIYKILIENGLTNDVNAFVERVAELESSPFTYTNKSNNLKALQLIAEVNRIKQNKDLWKETYENAQTLGGFGEVAVGKQGELFVKDGNSFKAVSINEYNKNRDKYNPLTVAELLRARQYDPRLVNNDAIFQVGETAYGTNEILKKVENIIKLVAEDSTKTEQHYSKEDLTKQLAALQAIKVPTEEQKNSIVKLQSMLTTPGEQYKVVQDYSSKKGYALKTMDYIASALTKEERLKLQAVASINGTTIGDLIAKSLTVGLSGEKQAYEISPEKVGAGEGDGGAGKTTNLSNDELFFSGKLNYGERFSWNDPETGRNMSMPVTGKMVWHNEGKPTGMITLNQAAKTDIAQYIYADAATFGGKTLSLADRDKIVQEDSFARVWLPTNVDGTPNLSLLKQYTEAQNEVEKHPDWSPEQINEFYSERGLGYIKVDEQGNVQTTANMRPFMVGYGYTTSQAAATSDNKNIEKVSSKLEKQVDSALEKVYKAAGVSKPTTMGTFLTDYYKGIIAYPIRETASIIAAANKGNVFTPKIDLETARIRMNTELQGMNVPTGTAQLLTK